MKIIKIKNTINKDILEEIKNILENNGLIVYPTDTLYALGANALSKEAIKKVFKVKGRDYNKPISIALKNLEEAKKYFAFNEIAEKIAKKFLPGPLTIILPSYVLPKELSPTQKFSFRIPENEIALKILNSINFPLTATSANVSGGENPTNIEIAIKQIGKYIDLILDSGECKYGKPSTVIDLSNGKIVLVREGIIPIEQLYSFLK
ncbi:MAG: L-threonylcarbamoyladenylate synthase [Candidatus Aenigmatarchaeota archaeon]